MVTTITLPDYIADVEAILMLFFPQFFDENDPSYVPPDILQQFYLLSDSARPWCLSEAEQNFAQAHFIAYLVSLRKDTMSGTVEVPVAGPVVSEKEGDISVSYADLSANTTTISKRPPSDPWDVWNRFWMRCSRGGIITRFGDPVKSGNLFTCEIVPLAINIWHRIW